MKTVYALFPFLALACPRATAQSPTKVLPPTAATVDLAWSWTGGIDVRAFRMQQAWPENSIARAGGTIQQVEFRSDAGATNGSATLAGTTIRNLIVTLGRTAMMPLSVDFGANAAYEPQTTVFAGTLSLPARGPVPSGPAPWFGIALQRPFVFANLGRNILLDMQGVGAGPGGSAGGSFPFDAENTDRSYGSARSVGLSGDSVLVPWTQNVLPGQTISIASCGGGGKVVAIAGGVLPSPIDLAPFGAAGQLLHVLPVVAAHAMTVTQSLGCPVVSVFSVTVPPAPQFRNARFAFQMLRPTGLAAPTIVTSNALEYHIGYEAAYASSLVVGSPAQQVGSYPLLGEAPVVRFTGQFFD